MQRGIGRLRARTSGSTDTDALAWQTAAIANGGTVSGTTLAAVSAFITSAKANGYWTKINRLNLFCGTGLGAAMTPQKVGGGSATETNVNFVSGDYAESTGLTSNGSTKYLNTGLNPSASLSANDTHMALYNRSATTDQLMGGQQVATATAFVLYASNGGSVISDQYDNLNGRVTGVAANQRGFLIGSRTASNLHKVFQAGSAIGSNATGGGALPNLSMFVFCQNNNGTPAFSGAAPVGAYSFGSGLSVADAANYYTDMQAFQTALSRQV